MVARATTLIFTVLLAGCGATDERRVPRQVSQEWPKPPAEKPARHEFVRPDFKHTVVLVYHDMVQKRDKDSLWFDCSLAEFEEQLDTMAKKGVKFVSLSEVEDELFRGKRPDGPQVAITFADNYAGFARWAWIPLRKRGIPVTIFAHTDFVGNKSGRPKMTWRQLYEFRWFRIVQVESQTCSHPEDITKLSDDQLRHEMVDSAKAIKENLNFESRYIAYPNGKYDQRVMEAARSAGYVLGFTEAQKPVETATDPMAVPRYVHTKWRQALRDIGVD